MVATIKLDIGNIRELNMEEKAEYPNYKYVVCVPCTCYIGDKTVIIPKGFLTDGSSGGPDYGWSWLIHDYLYATHKFEDDIPCSRREADDIMYRVLLYERHKIYAFVYRVATSIAPCVFNRYWLQGGERGPNFIDDCGCH
jgi:hypothetical protein